MEFIQTPDARRTVRRLTLLTVLVSAICFGLSSLVLIPVYIQLASNIATSESFLTWVLYYLTEEGLIDFFVYAICYPATMYAVWHVGLKRAVRIPVAFSLITLGRFVLNYVMSAITDSALPDWEEFLTAELPMIGTMLILELLQYALPILFTLLLKKRYLQKQAEREALEGKDYRLVPLLPITRLFSFSNPLQFSALLMGVVIFAFTFGAQQIYQYALYITTGYTDGWLIMALDLIADLFIAVILYFAALLLFSRFHRKDLEAAANRA